MHVTNLAVAAPAYDRHELEVLHANSFLPHAEDVFDVFDPRHQVEFVLGFQEVVTPVCVEDAKCVESLRMLLSRCERAAPEVYAPFWFPSVLEIPLVCPV